MTHLTGKGEMMFANDIRTSAIEPFDLITPGYLKRLKNTPTSSD